MEISAFLDRCDRFRTAYGDSRHRAPLSEARLSTVLFGSGVTLDRLRLGKGITVRVLARAIERLAIEEGALADRLAAQAQAEAA
jgi:hypothetical protein